VSDPLGWKHALYIGYKGNLSFIMCAILPSRHIYSVGMGTNISNRYIHSPNRHIHSTENGLSPSKHIHSEETCSFSEKMHPFA